MYDLEEFGKMAIKIIDKLDEGYAFVVVYGPSGSGKSSAVSIARKAMTEISESYCIYGCIRRDDALVRMVAELSTDRDIINVFSTCNRNLADQLADLSLPVVYLTDK